jgi:hypothetical protein
MYHFASAGHFGTPPKNDFTKTLIPGAAAQLNSLCESVAALKSGMNKLASQLPEYETVLAKRSSLARFAGIEPPENQPGQYSRHSRRVLRLKLVLDFY